MAALQQAEQKNAELTARLEIRERINGALVNQLEHERQQLQKQTEQLQKELQELEEKNRQYCELNTLLKEELAWFKAQVYGRSSEKSSTDVCPDQSMLFNEPEVLAAIGAAIGTEADAVITIEEHQRKRKAGRKAIPLEFPRVSVIHDIPESE